MGSDVNGPVDDGEPSGLASPTSPDLSNPARGVVESVGRTLELTRTWLSWDGRPFVTDDGARIYTPAKVVRRAADHLIDHLAEVEALRAGAAARPDGWHGSLV